MGKYQGRLNSGTVIARLLDMEGFTPHLANLVERYWKKNSGLTDRQRKQIVRLDKCLSELALKLTEGERLALGRFIGLRQKMSFETGLKVGLTAHAVANAKDYNHGEESAK